MKRFVPKYLDPASRLGEILFGLIMEKLCQGRFRNAVLAREGMEIPI